MNRRWQQHKHRYPHSPESIQKLNPVQQGKLAIALYDSYNQRDLVCMFGHSKCYIACRIYVCSFLILLLISKDFLEIGYTCKSMLESAKQTEAFRQAKRYLGIQRDPVPQPLMSRSAKRLLDRARKLGVPDHSETFAALPSREAKRQFLVQLKALTTHSPEVSDSQTNQTYLLGATPVTQA